MKSSRYSPEQVAFGLRQAEEGRPASMICRKMGIREPTVNSVPFDGGKRSSNAWVWPRSGGPRFWRRRTACSGSWWPNSDRTSRCCRMCSDKSPEACTVTDPGQGICL